MRENCMYGSMRGRVYALDCANLVLENVGGGYPGDGCGLSDIALDWMKQNAEHRGLKFRNRLKKRPRYFDLSSLKAIHNEEALYDPIKVREYHMGQLIDRSIHDRVKTQSGYFPCLAGLIEWLKGVHHRVLRSVVRMRWTSATSSHSSN